jgi:RHS repeat-associated protein
MLRLARSTETAVDSSVTDGPSRSAGRLWLGAIALGVALAVSVCVVVLTGGSSRAHVVVVASRASMRVQAATGRAREHDAALRVARRERWLASPRIRAQRLASQMAFHGLSGSMAQRLLVDTYHPVLAGFSANPGASIARSGRVVRYEGNFSAVVRSMGGRDQLQTSTVPLQVAEGSGGSRPVDLDLHATSKAFVPEVPVAAVSIPRGSGGAVWIGSAGVRVGLEGANVAGSLVGRNSVFFAGVGVDMDGVVTPTVRGADFSVLLRSRLSPEQLRYRVTLPAGAQLQAAGTGAVIERSGMVLARILAPSARDAQGTAVPVGMQVADGELLLKVAHRGRHVAYPVLVDPEVVVTISENIAAWNFHYETETHSHGGYHVYCEGEVPGRQRTDPCAGYGDGFYTHGGSGGGTPFTIGESNTLPFLGTQEDPETGKPEEDYTLGGGAEWFFQPESAEGTTAVEFQDISSSGSLGAEEAGQFELGACDQGTYWGPSEAAPASVRMVPETKHPCTKSIELVVIGMQDGSTQEMGEELEPPHKYFLKKEATMSKATMAVGVVTVTRRMTQKEEELAEAEGYGEKNAGKPYETRCFKGKPVNCATGNEVASQTDLRVGGRGLGLEYTRTYNSLQALKQVSHGPLGYGWSGSYSAHIVSEPMHCGYAGFTCETLATVYQDNGSAVRFTEKHGVWYPEGGLVQATLREEGEKFFYTLPNQTSLTFTNLGVLQSETDRNGNTVTVTHNSEGRLETVSDATGRKLTFSYNSEGEIKSVTDPMGHVVSFTYESGSLATVIEPGETKPSWQYKYSAYRLLTSETDGREHAITTEYDGYGRATSQTDAMGRKRKWEYAGTAETAETKITEPNTSVTIEKFNILQQPTSVTHAYGTSLAATTSYEYNGVHELAAVTDPNKHKTEYGYDEAGNRTSEKDPDGDETKWKYDSKHDIETETTPNGETTTIKRNSAGDPEVIERPAPGSTTQKTTYKYASNGDVESMTDPLEHTWKYEYDSYGARTAEMDPEGNKRTWGYNEDSQETSTVSPRGNVTGGNPAEFKTTIERDSQGRPVKVTEPAPGEPGKPVNRIPAVISGAAQEAQTLTGAAGIWEGAPSLSYSYQWEHCNASGASCANVSGATSSTYALGSGDVGYTVRVVVTATNTSGSATSTSEASAVVVSAVVWGYAFGSGTLHHPDGDAVDAKGRLWVTSSSGEPWLQMFSPEGEQLATYGATGTGKGDFEDPTGIAVNKSTGAVYVSDGSNDRIQEFSEAGVAGKEIGKKGAGAGELEKPVAVALDSSGDLWVADYTGQRISEFNKEGTFLKAFGWGVNKGESKIEVCTTSCKVGKAGTGEGELYDPAGVEYAGGYIHVVDYGDDRLQKFTTAGEYVGDSGGEGSGNGDLAHPGNETTEVEESSYVADAGNNRVEKFTGHGVFVDVFGSSGTGNGQFSETGDVAITPTLGELFVTDPGNNRVQKWASTTPPEFAATIGAGDFTHPGDAAIDPKGRIWVTNAKGSNPAVQVFSATGTREATYGEHGSEKGKYTEPGGITVNQSTSNVYVADGGAGRIDVLSETGTILKEIGTKGTGAGQMADPVAVGLDPSGDIWVADRTGQRIEEFNKEGTFVKAVGWGVNKGESKLETCTTTCKEGKAGSGEGQFNEPTGIVYTEGYLHIVDAGNDRLEKFSTAGEYIGHAASAGSGDGQLSHPQGITAGAGGNMYVADAGNNRVEEFNPYGTFIAAFGSVGSGSGQLREPAGLAVGAGEEIYVADAENNRLQKWLPVAGPVATALPTVSGEILVGQVLSASTGTWSALPAPSYSYQWERCNSTGESCSNISGATSATYTLASGDEGHTIRVVATATNSIGSAASTSPATELLAAAPTTEYHYDADGNLESVTDANGHSTSYTYDADNELTKVKEPNGTVTETAYDSMGQITSQTDGNKHATEYKRNLLEEIEESVNPLGKKTSKEYNAAGSLVKMTDPKGRTTTYTYDPANRLTEVSYSSGSPATSKYEYNKDGDLTKMTDGTGITKYEYDQLDRLTESENGHKEIIKYAYNLANTQTKITYPNGKAVERAYDKDERLESVTDWLSHATKFAYNPDSGLKTITYPSETKDEDTYAYNHDDEMREVAMLKNTEALASLTYARDSDGQVKQTTAKGLPGSESIESTYDENNRLTKSGSTESKYDAANNPTKEGASEYAYNAGDELEKGTGVTYSYDELGERTKTTPTTGPATTYGYDQASELTSVERPKEGETTEIKDTYTYNGERLRVSQTIAGTTTYMAWDTAEELPLLLSDGTNSYIYGPNNLPLEQISSGGTATYLHHDQAGSTRLLTGSAGTVTGKCTYSAYGTPTCEGATTTPLGYGGQYTSSDTGFIYLRNRTYDPATAQFLTVDPLNAISGEPYSYADDNPVNFGDPSGLLLGIPGTPSVREIVEGISHVAGGVALGASVATVGCAAGAAPTVVGEVVCGGVGVVALAAGGVATTADGYLAVTGAQSPLPVLFDAFGLGAGAGAGFLDGALGEPELGAYAKIYGSLLSAIAYGGAYAESAYGDSVLGCD